MCLCKQCGINPASGDLCSQCTDAMNEDKALINHLVSRGHTRHCACRQVWGDGECECDWYRGPWRVKFTTA